MGAARRVHLLSFEEYLALEEKARRKHELVDGVLYAMAGASSNHNLLVTNVAGLLWSRARGGGCRVFSSDMKLRVDAFTSYYPDVMVVCEPDRAEYYKERPCLLVEVLSSSTEATDRREKLAKYRQIPSLRAYVLIDSLSRRVEAYYREGQHWLYLDVAGEGSVPIPCPEMSLNLDEIYEGVEVPYERPTDEA
ncbi:Uma2 family endonuclease [Meiothermus sp. CFH 77666]|uniref:Uma2 family endonuclease n=1 Tax=Meiothermus sp. CFH 77666 TaxID=2817942 RepID=UPI001AA06BF4|nr:Uma2 family endonuclease [Meiothermus sp. CFH 77666]MBO1437622.1 Uma2 family endonuclease [Meiothermus sp. CFH 77666]